MAYRSNLTALFEQEAALERELQSLRGPETVGLFHAPHIARLEAELERLRSSLAAREPTRRRLHLKIQPASPCPASWEDMRGNDRVRFCETCKKNVYNFSSLTGEEAFQLLNENEGRLCAKLFRRWDGSILTSDCPRRRRIRLAQIGAGIGFGAATLAAMAAVYPEGRAYMGMVGTAVEGSGSYGYEPQRINPDWNYELDDVPVDLGESTYNRRDPERK